MELHEISLDDHHGLEDVGLHGVKPLESLLEVIDYCEGEDFFVEARYILMNELRRRVAELNKCFERMEREYRLIPKGSVNKKRNIQK